METENILNLRKLKQLDTSKGLLELADEEISKLEDLIIKSQNGKGKAFKSIAEFAYQLRINEKLMDLKNPNIPEDSLIEIEYVLENPNKIFRPKEFSELYEEDDLGKSINNLQIWLFEKFSQLSKYK